MSKSLETSLPSSSPSLPRRIGPMRQEALYAIASPLALLVLWEAASRTGLVDARILPPPSAVIAELVSLAGDGELWGHVGYTAARFAIGMALGTIPGVLLGLTMGISRTSRLVLQPIITALYPLPRIALFPLFLILIGLNEKANVLMIALGPFFTMVISTMAGVMNIDPIYRDVAQSYETRRRDLYFRVMLPAALPVIMSGVQISVGLALMSATAVEYLNADQGLGYLIWHSWQILSLKLSLAALLAAGLLGAIIFAVFQWLERRLLPWQAKH